MDESRAAGTPESLLEAMRIQTQTRRRLRELQALHQPTDDERDEAWSLLRATRMLAAHTRRLRSEAAKARLGGQSVSRNDAAP
jgi:hypothetical protein